MEKFATNIPEYVKTTSSDNLSKLALSTLALRVGDVSRDSGDDAVAQSGEQVHVNKSLIDNTADAWENEVKNDKCVTANGKDMTIGDSKEEKEEAEFSRKCHAGEQNIIHNKTYYNKEKHQLVHEVLINNGTHAQLCTAEAIKEHIGEFASAGIGKNINMRFKTNKMWAGDNKIDAQVDKFINKLTFDNENLNISYEFV